jgi:hypothetical protein
MKTSSQNVKSRIRSIIENALSDYPSFSINVRNDDCREISTHSAIVKEAMSLAIATEIEELFPDMGVDEIT